MVDKYEDGWLLGMNVGVLDMNDWVVDRYDWLEDKNDWLVDKYKDWWLLGKGELLDNYEDLTEVVDEHDKEDNYDKMVGNWFGLDTHKVVDS